MRLIDADRLKEYVNSISSGLLCEWDTLGVLSAIDKQQTIDTMPIVHGCWIKASGMMPPEYFGKHVCSICNAFAPNKFHGTHEWLSKICPSCGAKMDEAFERDEDS